MLEIRVEEHAPAPANGSHSPSTLPKIALEKGAPSGIDLEAPVTLEAAGISEALLEQIILKILYFRGDLLGRELAEALGLKFSLIHELLDRMKLQHAIEIKRSMGLGNLAALFSLTEIGRNRARLYLELNQYAGAAPVPLAQYESVVRRQRRREGWLTPEAVARCYSRMVLSRRILSQVGPAVSSGTSFLIYGKPGDGKTFLAEALADLDSTPVFVPYAVEHQGNIIQVFDPVYHRPIEAPDQGDSIFLDPAYDARWIRCRRPFLMSGGELTLDLLDLSYNDTSKVYEAPLQMKANNGIYLVDDFGRQRATPAEVLNRWILPLERHVDFLNFQTGGKVPVPFEVFLVFSTNLNPENLGDEAFLRRLQYKLCMRGPDESEYKEIFRRFCAAQKLACSADLLDRFVDRHYHQTGKPFRRCQPRDILSHAINLMRFESRTYELNDEVLDEAFESCFLEEQLD